jgi:broad specificity phosphatase PhoE
VFDVDSLSQKRAMPVTVLRHCKSLYNSASKDEQLIANRTGASHPFRDADLSAEGEQQLAQLVLCARKLFPEVRAVFTSPYRRALRTAIPIAAVLGAQLFVSTTLREIRHDVGDIGTSGVKLSVMFPGLGLEKLPDQWWRNICSCPETKECDKCVVARVESFRELAKNNSGALFVSHSDIMIAACDIDVWNGEFAVYDPEAKDQHVENCDTSTQFGASNHQEEVSESKTEATNSSTIPTLQLVATAPSRPQK